MIDGILSDVLPQLLAQGDRFAPVEVLQQFIADKLRCPEVILPQRLGDECCGFTLPILGAWFKGNGI